MKKRLNNLINWFWDSVTWFMDSDGCQILLMVAMFKAIWVLIPYCIGLLENIYLMFH